MKEQIDEVIKELYQANFKHNLFVSEHEGMGVLQEKVYELWDAIRSNDPIDVYHEATQVAAMAVKLMMYIDSLDEHECLCDDAEETEIERLRRKHRDCMNREKYGDAFDQMLGFPKI